MKPAQLIAVCGLPGSFSEVAAREYLTQVGSDHELRYCSTAAEVVATMQDGAALGVVPVENSVAGKVGEAEAIPADAKHVQVVTIPVRHQLMVKPGTTFESVRRVVSHEQALAQCATFLREKLPQAEQVPYPDTAQAAKDLAAGKLEPTDAVIASERAAQEYGLETIREHIQDDPENRTRFLVFALSGR
ncbi:MAG: prephenate dehydratase domain-containing protein [bacterium]|nr:prephenate dehydratase domain-containing protein [bacterium]MDZ4248097.1 prephenate dehydratase domain-containing protein [Patescibacteria group bacterium]